MLHTAAVILPHKVRQRPFLNKPAEAYPYTKSDLPVPSGIRQTFGETTDCKPFILLFNPVHVYPASLTG